MQTVWITHPKLDDKVEVPASALQEHQRAGWRLTAAPDTRPAVIQALIDGGWDPDEARTAVEAAMPDPPPDGGQTTEAPAPAGASSLPETQSPKGRRTNRGDE